MSNKKKLTKQTFDLELAFATADKYLVTADQLNDLDLDEKNVEDKASMYVVVSNLSFAIEVYLKSIIYMMQSRNVDDHDLARLWKQLPIELRNYISHNFKRVFDSDNEEWTTTLIWISDQLESETGKFYLHGLTAEGILKGHRLAYETFRYAYEKPFNKTKAISYNINGLITMSWFVRSTARHFYDILIEERRKGPIDGTREIHFEFPKSTERFP